MRGLWWTVRLVVRLRLRALAKGGRAGPIMVLLVAFAGAAAAGGTVQEWAQFKK